MINANLNTINASRGGVAYNYDPVILDFGQSNVSGSAELNRLLALSSYVAAPAGVKIWSRNSYLDYKDTGTWVDLVLGSNNQPGFTSGAAQFGGEGTLGPEVHGVVNKTVYYIKFGVTSYISANGSFSDWDPVSVGKLFNTVLANFVHTALSAMRDAGLTPKIIGMHWKLGESDATDNTLTAQFGTHFATFVTAWRAASPYLTNVPLFISKVYYAGSANEITINAAYDTYAASDPTKVFVIDVPANVTYPRKQDIPAGEKALYPPSGIDDSHDSHYTYEKMGQMVRASMVTNAVLANTNIVAETYSNYEVNRAIDKATLLGYTSPNAAYLTKLNTLITSIKAITAGSATWKKIHGMYMHDNTGSVQWGDLNIKNPIWGVGVRTGSPTWTSGQGLTFDGATQWFDVTVPGGALTNIDPTPYSNLCMISFVDSWTSFSMGIANSGASSDMYLTSSGGTGVGLVAFWSTESGEFTTVIPVGTRFFGLSRIDATRFSYYLDDTKTDWVENRTTTFNGSPKFGYTGFYKGAQVQRVSIFGQGFTQAEMAAIRTALVIYRA